MEESGEEEHEKSDTQEVARARTLGSINQLAQCEQVRKQAAFPRNRMPFTLNWPAKPLISGKCSSLIQLGAQRREEGAGVLVSISNAKW